MNRGWGCKLGIALAFVFALAATAPARGDAVPKRFFGVHAAAPAQGDFQQMVQGGVRICRIQVDWAAIEPSAGTLDWKAMDAVVAGAARSGVELMPLLIGTPQWVSPNTVSPPIYSAEARAAWSDFVSQLVGRYGSSGSFWAANPEIPRHPIVIWQIWNEVNTRAFWGSKPKPGNYARLVWQTAGAIRGVDPAAKVILAGLLPFKSLAPGSVSGIRYLSRLLRFKAVRKLSDGVAIHPYGKSPRVVLKWLLDARDLLNRSGGRRLPLWVTEFGWSTGGVDARRSPVSASLSGQARRVARTYAILRKNSKRLRLKAAFYFSYEDIPVSGDVWIGYMGLFDGSGQPKPAWFAYARKAGGRP